ncbi:MAG: HD-GYP domain-containing protein [Clostridiales bacterium]|nr:HD-GYP domain-containing protein [Clostridiales bacterium]
MKHLLTASLKPGMITGENVFAIQGRLLIPKGTTLTRSMIEMLNAHGVPMVRITDEIPPAPAVSSPTYMQRVRESEEFARFQKEYDEHIERFQTVINDLVEKNTSLNVDGLLHDTLSLLYQNGQSINIMDMLMNVRHYDDSTYTHCINVALICHVFSDWLQFTKEQQRTATLCGLFHDIGKLAVSKDIIQKPARLTKEEFDAIKEHSLAGYEILSRYDIDEHVRNAALMHHEKCDGSGYPHGLRGPQIDMYAKMVTIADIYDAMTSRRVYREPICPFEVIRQFELEGIQKYDTRFILVFLENVVSSYLNQRVHLSNGMEGDIIFINRSDLSCPTIRCDEGFVDLTEDKNLYIEYII